MKDLRKYSFGKIGNGAAIHIVLEGKALCNSSQAQSEEGLTAKDVNCKRCINPMHKYKPYNDLLAAAGKGKKPKQKKDKENEAPQVA